jgi:hypothetical protein
MNYTLHKSDGQEFEILKGGLPPFLTFDLSNHPSFSLSVNARVENGYSHQEDYNITRSLLETIPAQYFQNELLKPRALLRNWILADVNNVDLIVNFARTVRHLVKGDYLTWPDDQLTGFVAKACYDAFFYQWFKDSTWMGLVSYQGLAELVTRDLDNVLPLIGLADYHAQQTYGIESGLVVDISPTIRPSDIHQFGYDTVRLKQMGLLPYFINSANVPSMFSDNPYANRMANRNGFTFRLECPALETELAQRWLIGMRASLVTGDPLPRLIQNYPLTLAAKFAYPDFTLPRLPVCRSLQSHIIIEKQPKPSSSRLQI